MVSTEPMRFIAEGRAVVDGDFDTRLAITSGQRGNVGVRDGQCSVRLEARYGVEPIRDCFLDTLEAHMCFVSCIERGTFGFAFVPPGVR